MTINRRKQVFLNSFLGFFSALLNLGSNYAVRITISKVLGAEVYGLNSTIYSIINFLLILELGVSASIVIFLYEPLANNHYEMVKAIVRKYRNIYRWGCGIVFIIGIIICTFGLKYLIHTNIEWRQCQICFLLYLIGVIFRYLLGYKRCLLFADQLNRIDALIATSVEFLFCVLEIASIYILQNYYIYLVLFIVQNIFINIGCNIYIEKKYPFIKDEKVNELDDSFHIKIFNVVKPMFIQRISNQVSNSLSLLFLSFFSSVVLVGCYSNYVMIVHAIQTFMSHIGNSFTTSFGNFAAIQNDNHARYNIYSTAKVGIRIIALVMCIGFYTLADCVILIFFGKDYLLDSLSLKLITFLLYISLISIIDLSVQNAVGLHFLDSKKMIIQCICVFILSLILGENYSLNGILVANIIPLLLFTVINKSYVLHLSFFRLNFNYFFRDIINSMLPFFLCALLVYVSNDCICLYFEHSIYRDFLGFFLGVIELFFVILLLDDFNRDFTVFKSWVFKIINSF